LPPSLKTRASAAGGTSLPHCRLVAAGTRAMFLPGTAGMVNRFLHPSRQGVDFRPGPPYY